MKVWVASGINQTTDKTTYIDVFATLDSAKHAIVTLIEAGSDRGNDILIRVLDLPVTQIGGCACFIDQEGHDSFYYITEVEVQE